MLRRLALSLLVAVLALGGAAVPAVASGSGDLFPRVGATDAACDATHPCRAALEWRTNAYGPAGDTQIRRRTLFTVFAHAGEQILTGSSSIGTGSADIAIWNPGQITDTEAATLPTVVDGTNGFSCAAHRPDAHEPRRHAHHAHAGARRRAVGRRHAEHRGLRALRLHRARDRPVPRGVLRCRGAGQRRGRHPGPAPRPGRRVPGRRRARRSTPGTSPSATADPASVDDLPGRTFTYVLAGFTGGNPRPVTMPAVPQHPRRLPLLGRHPRLRPQRLRLLRQPRGLPRRRRHDAAQPRRRRHGHRPADAPVARGRRAPGPAGVPAVVRAAGDPRPWPRWASPPRRCRRRSARSTSPVARPRAAATWVRAARSRSTRGPGAPTRSSSRATASTSTRGCPGNRALRGVVPAGTFTVAWDGNDNTGVALPVKNGYAVRAVLRARRVPRPDARRGEARRRAARASPCSTRRTASAPSRARRAPAPTARGCSSTTAPTSRAPARGSATSRPGTLCPAFAGAVPAQLFADPATRRRQHGDRARVRRRRRPQRQPALPGDGRHARATPRASTCGPTSRRSRPRRPSTCCPTPWRPWPSTTSARRRSARRSWCPPTVC